MGAYAPDALWALGRMTKFDDTASSCGAAMPSPPGVAFAACSNAPGYKVGSVAALLPLVSLLLTAAAYAAPLTVEHERLAEIELQDLAARLTKVPAARQQWPARRPRQERLARVEQAKLGRAQEALLQRRGLKRDATLDTAGTVMHLGRLLLAGASAPFWTVLSALKAQSDGYVAREKAEAALAHAVFWAVRSGLATGRHLRRRAANALAKELDAAQADYRDARIALRHPRSSGLFGFGVETAAQLRAAATASKRNVARLGRMMRAIGQR